jgi:hypothetical protein
VILPVSGQDIGWLLEQTPTVSQILVKAFEKTAPFTARVEVSVAGKADPEVSAASAAAAFRNGSFRWDVKLKDVKSPQLSANAKSVIRQVNGEQFVVLIRPDEKVNYLLLPHAQAYLKQDFPPLKLSTTKGRSPTERLAGRECSKEKLTATPPNGEKSEVLVWRDRELKNFPVQIQITDAGEVIQLRFSDIQFRTGPPAKFAVPAGLTKYGTVEDLVQSVLLARLKKRMGLE